MTFLWIILGLITATALFFALVIGINYIRISRAWAWQPKSSFVSGLNTIKRKVTNLKRTENK